MPTPPMLKLLQTTSRKQISHRRFYTPMFVSSQTSTSHSLPVCEDTNEVAALESR